MQLAALRLGTCLQAVFLMIYQNIKIFLTMKLLKILSKNLYQLLLIVKQEKQNISLNQNVTKIEYIRLYKHLQVCPFAQEW